MLKKVKSLHIYFLILALCALANGLSDGVLANYFKDAYDTTAFQRGLIEFPRELPGVLCIIIVTYFASLGDLKLAIGAQLLTAFGILILGTSTPTFSIMLIFLFINSLGMHLFMPLQDSIGLSLIDKDEAVGRRMGQYKGITTAFTLFAGLITFFGFSSGLFSFKIPFKMPFVIAGILFIIVAILLVSLQRRHAHQATPSQKPKLVFERDYKYYYTLAIMNGVQKQVMIVYGPWVLVDLLNQPAEVLALIGMGSGVIGIFFLPLLGRLTDRFGVSNMLFVDAISFIVVYLLYGLISQGFVEGVLPVSALTICLTIFLLMIDKMSMQMSMVRVMYLRSIVKTPEHITPTLSLGISMDHIVTIVAASLGGVIWTTLGAQYIFYFTALLSLVNLCVAFKVKRQQLAV